jgi:DNA-binding response OmpR family regulator
LDWQVPELSGIEVLRHVRETLHDSVPVVFATQRKGEQDIVEALDQGADDYLVKPIRHRELLARINALQRRAGFDEDPEELQLGPIRISLKSQTVTVNDVKVKLTHKDYLLSCCLLRNFGKVLSREFLLKEVWGIGSDLHTRTVDVHVSRLRRSLNIGPDIGYYIKTIYHHGYRLEKIED